METRNRAIAFAVLAAALYALNIPLSKLLLEHVAPTMMAALLYLGAGLGLWLYGLLGKQREKSARLSRKELPFTIAMVLLDILAPILLMLGIQRTSAASASLLNNFEIVATSLIALLVFREAISGRLWLAILLITLASILLSFEGGMVELNAGSLLVLAAALCWGLENNCTRMMSRKSSIQIVTIKGLFSGLGSLITALLLGERLPSPGWLVAVLLLGFVAYGLSIHFYILAQRDLGAAKTSGYYAIAPFLGVAFSLLVLQERPGLRFALAFLIMGLSAWLMAKDAIALQHTHTHAHHHSHEHLHGSLLHSHAHAHEHEHLHAHGADSTTHDHDHKDGLCNHSHTHDAPELPAP